MPGGVFRAANPMTVACDAGRSRVPPTRVGRWHERCSLTGVSERPPMIRLPFVVLLLAVAVPAVARAQAAVEDHLMRLSPAAVTLGRTPADASVQVVLGLRWRDGAGLEQLIRDIADPQSPAYQRFRYAAGRKRPAAQYQPAL